jgi:eukaryotic-like serine/threonine-protein kinase
MDTNEASYQRAKSVFQAALEQPEHARAAYVESACGGDSVLHADVMSLLAAAAEDTGFLERPPQPTAAIDAETLGLERGWRVIRELARGGMGVVYLAERADGAYRQQVALKLLHLSPLLGEEPILRLKLERQILARLDHPNIARLLDGGSSASGMPYLVMEYVEGERIDHWCNVRQLDVEARLRLFLKVCEAVAYAHRNLIVHRDLKPDNVLVTAAGEPKLLDFGIARHLSADAGLTGDGARLMTPRYASPEQIRGEAVTTLSDVYALGVLLYELLTGASPYGAAVSAPQRLPVAICETDAVPPSRTLASGGTRSGETPTHLEYARSARSLRGDLDAIVLRCLRKTPEQRYASVEALAEDIHAHLDGRPVSARQGDRLYRAGRFARRHWVALATAAGVLVLSLAFVMQLASQLQLTRAEQQRAQAAEALAESEGRNAARARDFLVSVFAGASPAHTLGEPISPRELLDRAAAQLQAGDEAPETSATVHVALASTYAALGDPVASATAAQAALDLLPVDGPYALRRADALEMLGMAHARLARYGQARPLLEEMHALRARAFADQPVQMAPTYAVLGRFAMESGDWVEARDWLQRALVLLEGRDASATVVVRAALVAVASATGDLELGALHWQEGERLASDLHMRNPARIELLIAGAALARRHGDFDLSLTRLLDAQATAELVVGLQAEILAEIHNELGVTHYGLGNYPQALEHLLRARAAYSGIEESQAIIDANIGAIYEAVEDYGNAIAHARAALAVQQRDPAGNLHAIRQVRSNLAQALSFAGHHEEALGMIQDIMADSAQQAGTDSWPHILDRFRHAAMLRRAGRTADARAEFNVVAPALDALLGDPEHPFHFYSMRLAAGMAADAGDLQGARRGLLEAIEFGERHPGSAPTAIANARTELAELLAEDDVEAARAVLAPALPVLAEGLPEAAPSRQAAERLAQRLGLPLP